MNRSRLAIWVGLAVFLGVYFGSPLFALHQMRQAAERQDAAALSAHIDFPALRASAKHAVDAKIARKLAAKPHRKPGTIWGAVLFTTLARHAIDDVVTPQGVAKLLASGDAEDSGAGRNTRRKQMPPDMRFDYEGLDVFLVHVSQAGLPGNGITLVMRRKGFVEWVLVGVRL